MKALKISLLVFFISSFTWTANAQLVMLDQNLASSFLTNYGFPDWNQIVYLGNTGSAGFYTIDNDPNGTYTGVIDVCYWLKWTSGKTVNLNVNISDPFDWVLIYEITTWDRPELVAVAYGEYNGTYIPRYPSIGAVYIRIIKTGDPSVYPPAPFRGVYFSW